MIEISNVSLPLDTDFSTLTVLRLSVDARKKSNVHFVASLACEVPEGMAEEEYVQLLRNQGKNARVHKPYEPLLIPQMGAAAMDAPRPVVVGSGPAGLFAALYLARAGLRPLVVERGPKLDKRVQAVEAFNAGGPLDPQANIQFGEGGAGTFSDGKLTTNIKNPLTAHVLRWFVEAGAPAEIEVLAKPHIGTDVLRGVIRTMRQQVIQAGGEFLFDTQLVDLECQPDVAAFGADSPASAGDAGEVPGLRQENAISHSAVGECQASGVGLQGDASASECADGAADASQDAPCSGCITGVVLETRDADAAQKLGAGRCDTGARLMPDGSCRVRVPAQVVILACGHSARDTFAMVHGHGAKMEQKPFSVGVRIEHAQRDIDVAQYGPAAGHPALGAADYKMAVHLPGGRSVYTFCMCPGGQVVCAASEPSGVVVNGMSNHARDGHNANSAVLVGVGPEDYGSSHPLAGVDFQRRLERAAYNAAVAAGGSPYQAPAQTVGSFLGLDRELAVGAVVPTYARGTVACDLHDCLPDFVTDALEQALPQFDRKLHGFAQPQAVMTGVETRSSSPVRIVRDASCQSTIAGLYPCGEGAGYAGGIMSAAVDGIKVAAQVAVNLQIAQAVRALKAGRTSVFPTDTVYGLAVSPAHAPSPQELFDIKGRAPEKPVAWLVPGADALDRYGADVPDYARELAKRHWPGALTLIVNASEEVPEAYTGAGRTIGLRMPDNDTALRIMEAVGGALATTSANASGQPATGDARQLDPAIISATQAVVIAPGGRSSGVASTVIDCTGPEPVILRQGDIRL